MLLRYSHWNYFVNKYCLKTQFSFGPLGEWDEKTRLFGRFKIMALTIGKKMKENQIQVLAKIICLANSNNTYRDHKNIWSNEKIIPLINIYQNIMTKLSNSI